MEGKTPGEEKKIKIINSELDSNINGVNENRALAVELNTFFFSESLKPLGGETTTGQISEKPVGWLDIVIDKLRIINAKNAGVCHELRRLHKETT